MEVSAKQAGPALGLALGHFPGAQGPHLADGSWDLAGVGLLGLGFSLIFQATLWFSIAMEAMAYLVLWCTYKKWCFFPVCKPLNHWRTSQYPVIFSGHPYGELSIYIFFGLPVIIQLFLFGNFHENQPAWGSRNWENSIPRGVLVASAQDGEGRPLPLTCRWRRRIGRHLSGSLRARFSHGSMPFFNHGNFKTLPGWHRVAIKMVMVRWWHWALPTFWVDPAPRFSTPRDQRF